MTEPNWPGSSERRRSRLLAAGEQTAKRKRTRSPARRNLEAGRRRPPSRYPPELWTHGQVRLGDLLPTQAWTLVGVGVCGAGTVAGLIWLGLNMSAFSPELAGWAIAPFSAEGRIGLLSWLSSVLLILVAQVAGAIFSFRRERKDDLWGMYRVWMWVAVACFVLSVHEATGLLAWVEQFLWIATGRDPDQDFNLWWRVPVMLFFAVIGSRLFVEYEECWAAKGLLVLAVILYGVAYIVKWTSDHISWPLPSPFMAEGAKAFAHVLLAMSVLTYGRRVLLEVRQAALDGPAVTRRRVRWQSAAVAHVDAPHPVPAAHHLEHRYLGGGDRRPGESHSEAFVRSSAFFDPSRLPLTGAGMVSDGASGPRSSPPLSSPPPVGPPNAWTNSTSAPATGGISSPEDGNLPGQSSAYGRRTDVASQGPLASDVGRGPRTISTAEISGSPGGRPAENQLTTGVHTSQSQISPTGTVRKLTKAEKKAIRKRLEELRAAREQRLAQSQGAAGATAPSTPQPPNPSQPSA